MWVKLQKQEGKTFICLFQSITRGYWRVRTPMWSHQVSSKRFDLIPWCRGWICSQGQSLSYLICLQTRYHEACVVYEFCMSCCVCFFNKMSSWAFCVLLSLHHALITFHVPVGLFIVGLLPVFIPLPVSHSCIFSDHLFVLLMFLSVFSHISQPIFLWKPFSAFLKIKNKTILTGGS